MKKIFVKIKDNILLYSVLFIIINIIVSFILYLFNIRFRSWVICLIILISVISLGAGICRQIYKSSENKKTATIVLLLAFTFIVMIILISWPFIVLVLAFSYCPEHTTKLDNKIYVAKVNSFLTVNVNYYEYYGPLLMGTKVKVHGHFGNGGFDPILYPESVDDIIYTYYDNKGKTKSIKKVTIIKDEKEKIIDKRSYDIDINSNNKHDDSQNYILPENAKVLYEKKFNKTILRIGKVDNILGGNILINVLRSNDDGKNFYVVSNDTMKVSSEAKFVFLSEKLGFVAASENVYLNNDKISLYVTTDGGETFQSSTFHYQNSDVDYISIEEVPYVENNILKIKCSVYQVNSSKSEYENKELIFLSNDNGLNWHLENS